jgi:two-component system sensor histidine kinase HydH
MVKLEGERSICLLGDQEELEGTLLKVLSDDKERLTEVAEEGKPTAFRAADFPNGTEPFLDPHAAGDVLAIPLGGESRPHLLLLLSRSSTFPFDRRDIVRAEVLRTLLHTLIMPSTQELGIGGRLSEVTAKVVEYLPSGIIVVDPKGKVFSVNRHGASILGTEPDELVNRDVARIFGLKRGDRLYTALRRREPRSSVEQEVVLPNGKTLLLGLSSTATGEESESERGFVLIFQDISERRRLQERLRRTEQLASLGAMAAGMAHEIRNPLASMLTGVQILGSLPPGDPRAKRHRETIIQQITRLNGIIRDLLTLGRPARPKRKACAIERPVRQAAEMIAARASEQSVAVELDMADTLPSVFADEGQIQQVLINLFLNALEAMPEGGKLNVCAREGKGNVLLIDVTDTGVGMSSEDIAHAFTPFFSTKAQGAGLGLTVCNRIVADHDGQLELRSAIGEGTTIIVELPVASPA